MENKKLKYSIGIVIATGLVSVSAQLIIIREFLSLFSGNEFIIAVTLFNWLVLGGIGTLLARFSQTIFRPSLVRLSVLSFFLCFLSIIEIFGIRFFYRIFFIHGLEPGFYQSFAFTFFLSAPFCILVGFLLPFSLYLVKNISEDFSSVKIYMADNIGDASGGALFSFVLVFVFTPVKAIIFSFIPLMLVSFVSLVYSLKSIVIPLVLAFGLMVFIIVGIFFEEYSLERKNCSLKFYRETPYGRVEVHEYGKDFSLIRDGVPLFDTKNIERAEQLVHYALAQLKNVKNILFVSASSNVFSEAEKHQPDRIDYIEIDPKVAKALFRFSFLKKSENIFLIHDDARHYLSKASFKKKYSAVIMDLPDPDNFGLNRFYTKEFFEIIRESLLEEGVFVFSIQGFENYPEENLLKKISSLYSTAASCFDHVLVLPFSQTYFILSQFPLDINIPERLSKKKLETLYIKKYFIPELVKFRSDKLKKLINTEAPLNSDFSPVIIKHAFGHWFSKFNTSPFLFGITASFLFILYLIFLSKSESILFFTGFSAMAIEIANIFVFQILFGYIYLKTGALITLFLAGLLAGAWAGEKIKIIPAPVHLLLADLLMIFLMLVFAQSVYSLRSALPQIFFLCFSFVFAVVCGWQFSIGIRLRQGRSNLVAGLFAADLMGAAAGLLIFSLVFLPFFGIFNAVIALCLIKSISLIRYRL